MFAESEDSSSHVILVIRRHQDPRLVARRQAHVGVSEN